MRSSLLSGIVAATTIITAACIQAPQRYDVTDPGALALGTQVERDAYEAVTRYVSPRIQFDGGSFFLRHIAYDDGAAAITQLYVSSVHYGRWHHYHSAFEPGRREHEVTQINSDVDCYVGHYVEYCTYTEEVGISLSLEELRRAPEGMQLKLSGSGGDLLLSIPGPLIQGFLLRIDDDRRDHPAALSTTPSSSKRSQRRAFLNMTASTGIPITRAAWKQSSLSQPRSRSFRKPESR